MTSGTLIGNTAVYVTTTGLTTAGSANVTVTNPNGTGFTLNGGYVYSMSITSVAPGSGPAAGGTVVTVNGCGFAPGTTVVIGATSVTSGTLIGTTAIYVTTAATSAGTYAVIVKNPNGALYSLNNGYIYWDLCLSLVGGSTVAFSTVAVSSTTVGGVGITIQNSGSGVNMNLQLAIVNEPAAWNAGMTVGKETFILYGLFNTTAPALGGFTTANDALSLALQNCTATQFAGNQAGTGIVPGGTRILWFRFDAPTLTTLITQQTIVVRVYATSQ
jgi:hypothetical protein